MAKLISENMVMRIYSEIKFMKTWRVKVKFQKENQLVGRLDAVARQDRSVIRYV